MCFHTPFIGRSLIEISAFGVSSPDVFLSGTSEGGVDFDRGLLLLGHNSVLHNDLQNDNDTQVDNNPQLDCEFLTDDSRRGIGLGSRFSREIVKP